MPKVPYFVVLPVSLEVVCIHFEVSINVTCLDLFEIRGQVNLRPFLLKFELMIDFSRFFSLLCSFAFPILNGVQEFDVL